MAAQVLWTVVCLYVEMLHAVARSEAIVHAGVQDRFRLNFTQFFLPLKLKLRPNRDEFLFIFIGVP
jgi:hypothetical protein